jgi:2Fe-2S ferredoxin
MKHKVTFLPANVTVEVDDEKYPFGDHGKGGSVLDVALEHGVSLEHNCGGNCACTTCHVIVRKGAENLSEVGGGRGGPPRPSPGLTPYSRLGCRAVVRERRDRRDPGDLGHERD